MRCHFSGSSGSPSTWRTCSRICLRYSAWSIGGRATPRMANSSGRWPLSARLKMAGSSLPRVRSPDAPKMTKMQGSARLGTLDMAAELRAQRGEQLLAESVIAAGAEPRVERCGEHADGDLFRDRRGHRPPSFAGAGNAADKRLQLRIGGERERREVEQPGADDAAAPPELRDLRQRPLVALVVGHRLLGFVAQEIEHCRLRHHQAVLNSLSH